MKPSIRKARSNMKNSGTNSSIGSSMSSGSLSSVRGNKLENRKNLERRRPAYLSHKDGGDTYDNEFHGKFDSRRKKHDNGSKSYDSSEDSSASSDSNSNDSGYRHSKGREHYNMDGTSPKKRNKLNAGR